MATSNLAFNPITGGVEVQVDGTAVATFKTVGTGGGMSTPASQTPMFSAYMSAASFGFVTGNWTKAPCNTKEFDTTNAFDATTNYRFLPTVSGYYQVNGAVEFTASSGLTRCISAIYKNGAIFKRGSDNAPASATYGASSVSCLIYLNGSTDYIELYGQALGTSPSIVGTSADYTHFSAALIARA